MIKLIRNNFKKSPEAKNPQIPLELLELSCLDEVAGGCKLAPGRLAGDNVLVLDRGTVDRDNGTV